MVNDYNDLDKIDDNIILEILQSIVIPTKNKNKRNLTKAPPKNYIN